MVHVVGPSYWYRQRRWKEVFVESQARLKREIQDLRAREKMFGERSKTEDNIYFFLTQIKSGPEFSVDNHS